MFEFLFGWFVFRKQINFLERFLFSRFPIETGKKKKDTTYIKCFFNETIIVIKRNAPLILKFTQL